MQTFPCSQIDITNHFFLGAEPTWQRFPDEVRRSADAGTSTSEPVTQDLLAERPAREETGFT